MKFGPKLIPLFGALMTVLTLSACSNAQAAIARPTGSAQAAVAPSTGSTPPAVIDVSSPVSPAVSSAPINVPAPDFNAVDVVTGKAVSLQQFAGKTILLNFVNYGCNPNINGAVSAQLQTIKQLKQQGVDFVPVSVFCGCCSPDVLRQFAKQNSFDWPWILDTSYSIAAKYDNYLGQYGYPTLVFIDKGMVIREYTGEVDLSALAKKIAGLATN
jgi:peroxiredoxin